MNGLKIRQDTWIHDDLVGNSEQAMALNYAMGSMSTDMVSRNANFSPMR